MEGIHLLGEWYGCPADEPLLTQADALRDLCRERFEQFGTAGHASKIKVIPLAEMARRYRKGALDPRIGAMTHAA